VPPKKAIFDYELTRRILATESERPKAPVLLSPYKILIRLVVVVVVV
jgi:hypothetical protein